MEDYKKLVNRLREEPKDSRKAVLSIYDLCIDAATAIENLSHRLDMAQGERDAVTRHMIELEQDVCRLKSRLAAYEDTGLDPEEISDAVIAAKLMANSKIVSCFGVDADHIRELVQAEQDGRLVVLDEKIALSMCAGARAIENNKRLFGVTYSYDIFGVHGGPKEISYFEAAKKLREIAELFLTREEAEAALKGGEG